MSVFISIDPPLRLRSPFNGELWPVPPEATPDLIEALLARGFTREPLATGKAAGTRKTKEPPHDDGEGVEVSHPPRDGPR